MVPRDASIAVYIMTNKPYGTLYIGVTSLFEARIVQADQRLHAEIRPHAARLVRDPRRHDRGHSSRKADEGVAQAMEDQSDRAP